MSMMWPTAARGVKRPATEMMAWGGGGASGSAADQVKQLQRSQPEARMQWMLYCDQFGEGMYDPTKHDEAFISSFMDQFNSGARIEGDNRLPEATKMLQKRSQAFKQCWTAYCADKGSGKNDPMKHDSDFHVQFYESLAHAALSSVGKGGGALAALGGGGKGKGDDAGMPSWMMDMMKAMGMPVPGGMAGMRAPGKGGKAPPPNMNDPYKVDLVTRIKAFQSGGAEQKQMWWDYCEQSLGGVRDPARHDVSTLQKFVTEYGVGPAENKVPGPVDPAKQPLVERIKNYQRLSPENKEAWYSFCGDTKDPAKHDSYELQQFITQYDIP